MPPIKFQLNPTYRSKADVVSRFSSWPPWRPSWILEQNQFSNSKSPCHPNASHQVWTQSDLPFGSRHGLKISRWPFWILEQNDFSNSESLCCSDASHQVSAQSNLVWEEMLFEGFQIGQRGGHLGYFKGIILAKLNLHVAPIPPTKFGLNPT